MHQIVRPGIAGPTGGTPQLASTAMAVAERVPRRNGDVLEFRFEVNRSFLNTRLSSPITVPSSFIEQLDERLTGEGPSWRLPIVSRLGRGPGRLRRSHTGGNCYYQLIFTPGVRRSVMGPIPLGTIMRVRISLLGDHLFAELSPAVTVQLPSPTDRVILRNSFV